MLQIRDVSPPSLGSTGSAVHLCIRNFVGGLGPIGEALLHPRDSHICVPAMCRLWCAQSGCAGTLQPICLSRARGAPD